MMKIFLLNLKQAFRNLLKNGWQSFFSVTGLVMGCVCLAYSVNWLWNETNHDSFRRGYKDVYFVHLNYYEDSVAKANNTIHSFFLLLSAPTYYDIAKALSGIDDYSVLVRGYPVELSDTAGNLLPFKAVLAVDSSYASMADLHSVVGNADHALRQPGNMVLSRSRAKEMFGSPEKAIGASVRVKSGWTIAPGTYVVGAVIADDGPMSNLPNDVLVGNFNAIAEGDKTDRSNFNYQMIVRTSDRSRTEKILNSCPLPLEGGYYTYTLSPLRTHHLENSGTVMPLWKQLIYPAAFVFLSVLLMLSAFFNYIAILTTINMGRVREYALRISMGASFRRNAEWMGCDVLLMLFLCFSLSGLVLEWINFLADIPQVSEGIYTTLFCLTPFFVLLMLLGFLYPVVRMKRIYKSQYNNTVQRLGVNKSLLFIQLFVCSFMLFVLSVAYRQMHSIFTADLGFRLDNMLRVSTVVEDQRLKDLPAKFFDIEARLNDGSSAAIVKALAMHSDLFENRGWSLTSGKNLGVTEEPYSEAYVRMLTLPYAAFEFFDMKMDKGDWFKLPINPSVEQPAIFNPEAIKKLNLSDYATRHLRTTTYEWSHTANTWEEKIVPIPVIGLMSFRTHTLHVPQEPLLIYCSPDGRTNHGNQANAAAIYVKYKPGHSDEARAAVCRVLKDFGFQPDLIKIQEASDYVNAFYDTERNYLNVFTAIAVGSVFITLFGVLSMILYTLRLQRRSIAVRRVFGATYRTLCRHYLRPYIVLTVVGNVTAMPLGYYLMGIWLEGYDYRIEIGWITPFVILLGVLLLVVGIVMLQIRLAMREDLARCMHVE